MLKLLIVLVAVLYVSGATYTKEAEADRILSLPGGENLKQALGFSGYLAINGSDGNSKMQHYWLVENSNHIEDAPLAFWTNG